MEGRGPQRVYASSLQCARRFPRSVCCGSLRLVGGQLGEDPYMVFTTVWCGIGILLVFPLPLFFAFRSFSTFSIEAVPRIAKTFFRDLDPGSTLQTLSALRTMLWRT